MRQHSTFQVILLFFFKFISVKFNFFTLRFILFCAVNKGFVLSASLHLTLVWLILLFALFKAFF